MGVLGRGNRRPGVGRARDQDRSGSSWLSPALEGGPCSLLASLVPQPRARWLCTQTAGWAGSAISMALAPAPRLPAPASTPPLCQCRTQGSFPLPWDAPARSLWPPPAFALCQPRLPPRPGAPRPCSRHRALVPPLLLPRRLHGSSPPASSEASAPVSVGHQPPPPPAFLLPEPWPL